MKFSIITACRNSARTIGRTLASVRAQEGANFEHIIVDGCSTDETVDIVRREAPHATLVCEPDDGIYDAMNKGIARASGDVIAMLNSDDHYSHERVLHDVGTLFDEGNAEAVFADVAFIHPRQPGRIIRRYRSDRFAPGRIRHGIMPAHPGMFVKKRVYDRFGSYSKDFPLAADFEFVARIFAGGGVKYVFHRDIAVMMLPGGASNSGLASKRRIFTECLRACRQNDIETSPIAMLVKYPIKLLDYLGPKEHKLHGRFAR